MLRCRGRLAEVVPDLAKIWPAGNVDAVVVCLVGDLERCLFRGRVEHARRDRKRDALYWFLEPSGSLADLRWTAVRPLPPPIYCSVKEGGGQDPKLNCSYKQPCDKIGDHIFFVSLYLILI